MGVFGAMRNRAAAIEVVVGKAPGKPGMAAQLPHVAPSQSGSDRMPTSTHEGTPGAASRW